MLEWFNELTAFRSRLFSVVCKLRGRHYFSQYWKYNVQRQGKGHKWSYTPHLLLWRCQFQFVRCRYGRTHCIEILNFYSEQKDACPSLLLSLYCCNLYSWIYIYILNAQMVEHSAWIWRLGFKSSLGAAFKFGSWVITCHCFAWMQLLIHGQTYLQNEGSAEYRRRRSSLHKSNFA